MKPSDAPTIKAKRSPVVLLVGFGEAFVSRCAAAAALRQASVVGIAAGEESNFVAHTLPVAAIFRPPTATGSPLARIAGDLHIAIATVDNDDLPDAEVERLIDNVLREAHSRRRG